MKCLNQEHTGRVFRLQFDEFQIVSSSHDDTILIWDFLNYSQESQDSPGSQRAELGLNANNRSNAVAAIAGAGDAAGRSPSRKFPFRNFLSIQFLNQIKNN